MRGAIFETWVVSEILKHRFNRGEHAGLYFYRDRHGMEADLVIEEGRGLTVVTPELINAGQRVAEILVS